MMDNPDMSDGLTRLIELEKNIAQLKERLSSSHDRPRPPSSNETPRSLSVEGESRVPTMEGVDPSITGDSLNPDEELLVEASDSGVVFVEGQEELTSPSKISLGKWSVHDSSSTQSPPPTSQSQCASSTSGASSIGSDRLLLPGDQDTDPAEGHRKERLSPAEDQHSANIPLENEVDQLASLLQGFKLSDQDGREKEKAVNMSESSENRWEFFNDEDMEQCSATHTRPTASSDIDLSESHKPPVREVIPDVDIDQWDSSEFSNDDFNGSSQCDVEDACPIVSSDPVKSGHQESPLTLTEAGEENSVKDIVLETVEQSLYGEVSKDCVEESPEIEVNGVVVEEPQPSEPVLFQSPVPHQEVESISEPVEITETASIEETVANLKGSSEQPQLETNPTDSVFEVGTDDPDETAVVKANSQFEVGADETAVLKANGTDSQFELRSDETAVLKVNGTDSQFELRSDETAVLKVNGTDSQFELRADEAAVLKVNGTDSQFELRADEAAVLKANGTDSQFELRSDETAVLKANGTDSQFELRADETAVLKVNGTDSQFELRADEAAVLKANGTDSQFELRADEAAVLKVNGTNSQFEVGADETAVLKANGTDSQLEVSADETSVLSDTAEPAPDQTLVPSWDTISASVDDGGVLSVPTEQECDQTTPFSQEAFDKTSKNASPLPSDAENDQNLVFQNNQVCGTVDETVPAVEYTTDDHITAESVCGILQSSRPQTPTADSEFEEYHSDGVLNPGVQSSTQEQSDGQNIDTTTTQDLELQLVHAQEMDTSPAEVMCEEQHYSSEYSTNAVPVYSRSMSFPPSSGPRYANSNRTVPQVPPRFKDAHYPAGPSRCRGNLVPLSTHHGSEDRGPHRVGGGIPMSDHPHALSHPPMYHHYTIQPQPVFYHGGYIYRTPLPGPPMEGLLPSPVEAPPPQSFAHFQHRYGPPYMSSQYMYVDAPHMPGQGPFSPTYGGPPPRPMVSSGPLPGVVPSSPPFTKRPSSAVPILRPSAAETTVEAPVPRKKKPLIKTKPRIEPSPSVENKKLPLAKVNSSPPTPRTVVTQSLLPLAESSPATAAECLRPVPTPSLTATWTQPPPFVKVEPKQSKANPTPTSLPTNAASLHLSGAPVIAASQVPLPKAVPSSAVTCTALMSGITVAPTPSPAGVGLGRGRAFARETATKRRSARSIGLGRGLSPGVARDRRPGGLNAPQDS